MYLNIFNTHEVHQCQHVKDTKVTIFDTEMKRFAEILTTSTTSTCYNPDINSLHPHNSPWWSIILEHIDQTGRC